jgi:hypothetical protein
VTPTARPPQPPPTQLQLIVTSPAFQNDAPIPVKYTVDGQGISPPLAWTGVPKEAKELVLVVSDPDAPGGIYFHWTLYGLSPSVTSLPESLPKTERLTAPTALQGLNSGGAVGYTPPSPPPGKVHHYRFHLYALRTASGLAPGASLGTVDAAVASSTLAQGELVGTYQR